jgi:hypothetical protein
MKLGWIDRLDQACDNTISRVTKSSFDELNRYSDKIIEIRKKLQESNISEEEKKSLNGELDKQMLLREEFRKKFDFAG